MYEIQGAKRTGIEMTKLSILSSEMDLRSNCEKVK